MTGISVKITIQLLLLLISTYYTVIAQKNYASVNVSGAMRNVMWKGQLYGSISLDTIGQKIHLYGLGPVEYLRGELLIQNGKTYMASVQTDTSMTVKEVIKVKAPFFVYANVEEWKEQLLPDIVSDVKALEVYLDMISHSMKRPFAFRLSGIVDKATIHIVNLPENSVVHNPDEAHKGQVSYLLLQEKVDVTGFFSTEHKGIFTHHDSFLHMHLLSADKRKMGHLEEAEFVKGMMLYLPKE